MLNALLKKLKFESCSLAVRGKLQRCFAIRMYSVHVFYIRKQHLIRIPDLWCKHTGALRMKSRYFVCYSAISTISATISSSRQNFSSCPLNLLFTAFFWNRGVARSLTFCWTRPGMTQEMLGSIPILFLMPFYWEKEKLKRSEIFSSL